MLRPTDALLGLALLALLSACSDDGGGLADGAPDLGFDGLIGEQGMGDLAPGDGGSAACLPGPALLSRVDPARMLADMKYLVGLGERMTHAGQTKAAAYLKAELAKLSGVQLREHSYSYLGQSYVNLEATIAGAELPDEYVMAGAHYDDASDNPTVAPGADDNASGTTTIVELARVLAGCKPRRSVRLVLFSNEDKGLIGSTRYVAWIKGELPPSKLLGFIAADMVAYGPDDEDLDLATRTAYKALVDQVAAAVTQNTTLKVKKIVGDQCG